MDFQLLRYLGESLGNGINAGLTYLFLAYQVIVSILVFLFDSGFPPWLVIVGWVLFLVVLGAQVRHQYLEDRQKQHESRRLEELRSQRIERLKALLQKNPRLHTACGACRNAGANDDNCRAHPGPAEREFRFQSNDAESYCLLWFPT